MAEGGHSSSGGGVVGVKGRPVSTTSSQLSISDRMTTDGEEEDNLSLRSNLLAQASSSCGSSLNLQQRHSKELSALMMARTTTISTIAMESNTSSTPSSSSPTRLVIALLQTPHRGLQLKVIELSPPLLKLPDNLEDAEDYLKNHNQVIKNLQSKQSPVEELLRQADNLIATQKPRAEVYAAMADSLGQTWKDLNGILEERKMVIQLAFNAHKNISECQEKIEKVHAEYSKINYMQHEETQSPSQISDSLKNLKKDRADILKRVSQCLESCDKLLHKIAEFNYTVDSRELVLQRDVEFATRQVHRWLERLHDRRIILEDKLKNKREQFEEFSEYSKYNKEIKDLEAELSKFTNFSETFSFGEDVSSCERKKEELIQIIKGLKVLQEKALLAAKRLEDAEYQRAKFYQRSSLKTKIYEILGQTNDLLTGSIDLDLSFVDAKDFFHLADIANVKLETITKSNTPVIAKTELNRLTYDALSKGEVILDSYGWESNKTTGVRVVHDNLLKKKDDLLEEIEHLQVLDEYNHFLECVNQAYQNILNIETSTLRQAQPLPVDLELVKGFKASQEKTLEEVSRKLNLNELMTKLDEIYPNVSEDEKLGTEEKINELKCLSNLIVELLIQRICVSDEWAKILELYENEGGRRIQVSSPGDRVRVQALLNEISRIYRTIQDQLDEVHRSDPDLITREMENKVEEIIKSLKDKLAFSLVNDRIREICHNYKVKLDHHLFGETLAGGGGDTTRTLPISQYYPVLTESEVAQLLHQKTGLKSLSTALNDIIRDQLQSKLDLTLRTFFQPLVTSFRQEVLEAQKNVSPSELGKKTQEEQDVERYLDRLKESYVTVTKEIQSYIGDLIKVCKEVEEKVGDKKVPETPDEIQRELNALQSLRTDVTQRIRKDLNLQLDRVLKTVQHEEPPLEAEKEARALRMMTSKLSDEALEEEIQKQYDMMAKILTERLIQGDLNQINSQLNDLISDLEQPCDYGDNLSDAQRNLANFERFEKTVELLEQKLTRMLSLADILDTDEMAKNLQGRLNELNEKRKRRKELIVLSLEYFRLIELSKKHYDEVNDHLERIRDESKNAEISIPEIEELLKQLRGIKGKEGEQERRLAEIERISDIIFADVKHPSDQTRHEPLRVKNTLMTGELTRVESDLTELLGFIKSRSELLLAEMKAPVQLEIQIKSQSPVPPVVNEPIPVEVIESIERLVVPYKESPFPRPTSGHEMCTQTSVSEEDERPKHEVKTSRQEVIEREWTTLEVMETLRASMSPLPPQTVEKETQFEETEEVDFPPQKVDRDTITQTIEEKNQSTETQTEGVSFLSTATETIEQINELVLQPLRPMSQEYLDPIFIQSLKDLVVNEGDRVVLECRTTGQVRKLLWLKDGMDISNNPDYQTEMSDDSVARLSIDEVFHEDSAIFTCRAVGGENDSVVVETSGKLTVREPVTNIMKPPSFIPHSSVSTGVHGKPHSIQIRVEGNPLPTVQWYRNSQCIDTSPDYIITFNNGLCEIQFDELLKSVDDGQYTCVAVNKVGEAATDINLEVKGGDNVKKIIRQKPIILEPLQKHLFSRAGRKLKLELKFESPTECTVIWFKDEGKVLTSANSGAEMKVTGNMATLTFQECFPVNSGRYTALVRNAGGEVQSECEVVVKGILPVETSDDSELNISDMEVVKPYVKMPLENVETPIGGSLCLSCVIVGYPEPEVIWYKNATPLKESPNHHLLFKGDRCSLIIKTIDRHDEGTYSVTAINNGGEASSSCEVLVLDKEVAAEEERPVEAPKFTKIIQDEMVTEGDQFQFVVELTSSRESPTEVTWWKNNKKLSELTDDVLIGSAGEAYHLRFNKCKLSDRGNYMAKACNSGGESKCFACLIVKENLELDGKISENQKADVVVSTEQPRKLSITKMANRAPRFVVPLEGRLVDEGEYNASLRCAIDAHPPAEIRWTKNNESEPLTTSSESNYNQLYSERGGIVELLIKKVGISDGGRYTCTASNDSGVASAVADLVVRKKTFPPVFSKRLQSVTLENGKRLYLEVDVFGTPSPEITWELNGRHLDSTVDAGISFKSDTPTRHSLVIAQAVGSKHDGEYKVTAKNEVGQASSSCVVTIPHKPVSPFKDLAHTRTKTPPPVPPKPMSTAPTAVKIETEYRNEGQGYPHGQVADTMTMSEGILIKEENSSYESRTSSTYTTQSHSIQEMPGMKPVAYREPIMPTLRPISPTLQPSIPTLRPVSPMPPRISTLRPISPMEPLMPTLRPISPMQYRKSPLSSTTDTRPMQPLESNETKLRPTTPIFPPEPSAPSKDIVLEPGPEPEILIAEAPIAWNKQKNQVLEKVKCFQYRSESPDLASPPTGGIRLVPQKEQQQKVIIPSTSSLKSEEIKVVNIPIQPLEQFPPSSTSFIHPPKRSQDTLSSTERTEYTHNNQRVKSETTFQSQSSSSEFSYMMQPSKFVPEKMRESDYESDFETGIAPKWQPSQSEKVSPLPITTSAFVSATSVQVPFVPITSFASSFANKPDHSIGTESKPEIQKPLVPPKPRTSLLPQHEVSEGVKGLIKSWPPQIKESPGVPCSTSSSKPFEAEPGKQYMSAPHAQYSSRLTPLPTQGYDRSRSPTPNREALEMDKLWSKPIRFASPSGLSTSPVPPVHTIVSPGTTGRPKQCQPLWSPQTSTSAIPVGPTYSAGISQVGGPPSPKPLVPPKPLYFSPKSPPEKGREPTMYYVSTVSTPRTTPIPFAFSPPPDAALIEKFNFEDRRDFFEQTSTSFTKTEESTSTTYKSISSSENKSSFQSSSGVDPGFSLLNQSFLPPPGEPPQFLYAPPPVRQASPEVSTRPQAQTGVPVPHTQSASATVPSQPGQMVNSSSSSSSMTKTIKMTTSDDSSKKQKPALPARRFSTLPRKKRNVVWDDSVAVDKTTPTLTKTRLVKSGEISGVRRRPLSMEIVPYIKPSIFTPQLDYASSLEKGYSSDQDSGPLRPKWDPTGDEKVTLTTWKRVHYEPPPPVSKPRRNSLTAFVDNRMQDLNQKFKDNISQMSQGLCYNKLDRKVMSDLGDDDGSASKKEPRDVKETVDANPLIYFKYDFGYEFGIADPKVVIRSTSEPPQDSIRALPSTTGGAGNDEQGTIHLPIIHEKSK